MKQTEKTDLTVLCTVCSEPLTFTKDQEERLSVAVGFKCPVCKQKNTVDDKLREFIKTGGTN